MSSEKSTLLKGVWSLNHYDLGEIRTESADRSTPPEKKERQGDQGNKKRLGNSKAPDINIFVIRILSNSYQVLTQEFLNNEFAIAN